MNLIANCRKILKAVETGSDADVAVETEEFENALERAAALNSGNIDEPVLALLNSSFFRPEDADIQRMAGNYSRRGNITMLRVLSDYAVANGLSWRMQSDTEKMQIIRQAVEDSQADGTNAEKILQDAYNQLEGIETRWF